MLQRYIDAHEQADAAAVIALLAADARLAMPPYETRYDGLAAAAWFFEDLFGRTGPDNWRLIATEANGQLAVVNYLRHGRERELRAITLDVLAFHDGRIAEVITFGADAVEAFGFRASLQAADPHR